MNTEKKPYDSVAQQNGLARWRVRVAEEKRQKVAELDELREDAVTVIRDGQEFKIITIPDKYAWGS